MRNAVVGIFLLLAMSWRQAGFAAEGAESLAAEPPSAVSSTIPYKKDESGASQAAGNAFSALIGVIGVACLGLWAIKRHLPKIPLDLRLPLSVGPSPNRRMKLVETMRIGPKASLYLVKWDERTFLIAHSGEAVTLIAGDKGGASDHGSGGGNANDR